MRYYGQAGAQAYLRWAVYKQRPDGDYRRLEQSRGHEYPGGNASRIGSAYEVRLPFSRAKTVPIGTDTLYVAAATTDGYYVYQVTTSTPALSTFFSYAQGDALPHLIPSGDIHSSLSFTVSFELVTCP